MAAINTKRDGDCGYVGFYKSKRYEVYAASTYEAQQALGKHLKLKPSAYYQVSVTLAEAANGSAVVHTAVN